MTRDIGSLLTMLHSHIGLLSWHANHVGGFLDRIEGAMLDGAYADLNSIESVSLVNDAKILRDLADKLLTLRNDLASNIPLQAAE